jgi:hypothetical protein
MGWHHSQSDLLCLCLVNNKIALALKSNLGFNVGHIIWLQENYLTFASFSFLIWKMGNIQIPYVNYLGHFLYSVYSSENNTTF